MAYTMAQRQAATSAQARGTRDRWGTLVHTPQQYQNLYPNVTPKQGIVRTGGTGTTEPTNP